MVFLPQILILFFFIAILEDSGYMARAAVIADRLMHRVGLQGKSFLPLLSAYACAVPAIMSARTVEAERDRIATIFVAPLHDLLGPPARIRAADRGVHPRRTPSGTVSRGSRRRAHRAVPARCGRRHRHGCAPEANAPPGTLGSVRDGAAPPYRLPTARSILTRLLDRTKVFLRRAGKIILTVTVVLWVLTQFPRTPGGEAPVIGDSALGQIGQVIEPAIEPLGFDWRIGIGLVTSLAAREVIVGTLGTI